MKQIFLNELPKKGKLIDWKNSIGYEVKFIYDDVKGKIEIVEYIKENENKPKLKILYNNNNYIISINSLRRCEIGYLLKRKTNEFKVDVGECLENDKRNITIIDRMVKTIHRKDNKKENKKYYKFHCNKCNFDGGKYWDTRNKIYKEEFWIEESALLTKKSGCACCSNYIVVKGINDIATTNPELVKYFVNIEDTYIHTYSSNDKVLMKCPCCEYEKELRINDLYKRGFGCLQCSDGISFPEKVMYNLLKQLNVKFITQYSKTYAKWCNKYKYDFYFKLNNEEYITETHGLQHYKDNTDFKMSLKEVQENDKNKTELAIKNGIKPQNYIIIDCRYSELEFIKNNILHSRLSEIFNLHRVDWIKIGQDSEKSLVKEVCEYWHIHNDINHEGLTTTEIGNILNINRGVILSYLKKGSSIGFCNYNAKEERKKVTLNMYKSNNKKIKIFKNGKCLGEFYNSEMLEKQSEVLFGVKLLKASIRAVARHDMKSYKGFTFEYV